MTTHVSEFISRAPVFMWCLLGALLTACGGSGSSPTGPTPPPSGPGFVASGQISIPASSLHARFASGSTAAANLGSTTGRVLSISLQDVSGSTGTCDARCPSIDWSIGTETFANRLTVMTSAGTQTFFLTQHRGLASTPDDPDPIWPFTELGGSTQTWLSTPINADIVAGSPVNIEVTMANRKTNVANVNWSVSVVN